MSYINDSSISGVFILSMKKPIVYGWYRNGIYLYIGSSKNGLVRVLNKHHVIDIVEPFLESDSLHIWKTTMDTLLKLERELILLNQPLYNDHFRGERFKNYLNLARSQIDRLTLKDLKR